MNVAPYEEALRQAGLQIAYQPTLDGTSGLLLMGGTDVDPDLYGDERRPETEEPDPDRDALELWLLADALSRNLPVLAICRGMQLMNVFHGGTLIQHLEPVETHRVRSEDPANPVHQVRIVPGTQLCRIFGMTLGVNSRHHQAVGKLGGGLLISARAAEDGLIEGIERPDLKFVVGVQWHPEDQPEHAGLFQAFASAVRSSSSSGMTSTPTSTVCSAPPTKTP